jgi:hypothetical protein
MGKYSTIGKLLLFFVLLGFSREACGDGIYRGEAAIKRPPEIPSQRAALLYRNGQETLVIESALSGEGQRFGWIIPLPSPPTKIEQASPGIIKTLSLAVGPKVKHDELHDELTLVKILGGLVALPILLTLVFNPQRIFSCIVVQILIGLLLAVLLLPALGSARGYRASMNPGVQILDKRLVGSYEIQVIKAENAAQLNQWLKDNGLMELPERGVKIASEYIKQGWCFATAKLQREGSGFTRPHPLAMTFAAKKPVYPMRLTSLTESKLYLELFVIAKQSAHVEGLTVEISDRYRKGRGDNNNAMADGMHYRLDLGHPALVKMMWEGCILTKLAGEVKPSDMDKDIYVGLEEFKPFQQVIYSPRGAREVGYLWGGLLWSGGILVGLVMVRKQINVPGGRWFILSRMIAPVTLMSLIVWGIIYLSIPKTDVKILSGRVGKGFMMQYPFHIMNELYKSLDEKPVETMNTKEFKAMLDHYFAVNEVFNEFTGERVRREDSPGNFTVEERQGKPIMKVYFRNGATKEILLYN